MEFTLYKQGGSSLVGIDICSSAVKLLELSRNSQGYRVESYAIASLPSNAVQENEVKNIEAIGNAIAQVVKESGTRTKYAAIALASSKVITKVIQLNTKLKEHELDAHIQSTAQKYIPFPLSEVNLDFKIHRGFSKNPEGIDILLVASRAQTVGTLVEVLSLGCLKAKVVDIETYAIERAFSLLSDQLPYKGERQTIALVDIGETMTKIIVLHDKTAVYNREYIFGVKAPRREIQHRYKIAFEETSEDYLIVIVQKVRRCLQLFFSSTPFTKIDHIILAGDTAILPGLVQLMEEKLEIPSLVALPFENMSIAPKVNATALHANSASLMICCGLAMWRFIHERQY